MRLASRLARLEKRREEAQAKNFRIICTSPVDFDLSKSECYRTRERDGWLSECILLEGRLDNLSVEEVERWIESFPIEELDPVGKARQMNTLDSRLARLEIKSDLIETLESRRSGDPSRAHQRQASPSRIAAAGEGRG